MEKKEYKWVYTICPNCGVRLPDSRLESTTPEPFISPYMCDECKYPEEHEARKQAEQKAFESIMTAVCNGEVKDAQGNPVEPVTVLQLGDGRYIARHYWVDLFGLQYTEESPA